jgi:acyl-CoA thioesterase YciA
LSQDARVPVIRVTAMPADTNPYGGVFGGWLMGQMGLAAGSLASRRSKGKAVVVAADELRFTGAMKVGDELSIYGEIKQQGTSSMTIAVEAVARHRNSEDEFPVATGTFKFVALDENGKPRALAAEEEANG